MRASAQLGENCNLGPVSFSFLLASIPLEKGGVERVVSSFFKFIVFACALLVSFFSGVSACKLEFHFILCHLNCALVWVENETLMLRFMHMCSVASCVFSFLHITYIFERKISL